MDTISEHIEKLYDKAKEYTETNIELYKLNALSTTADVVSSLVSKLVLVIIILLFTLFFSTAISLLIGDQIGDYYLGFLIVSGFYLILAILIYFFKNKLIKAPVTNRVIGKILKLKRIKFKESNTDKNE